MQGSSKVVINRCMELLHSRIAGAQTRHIGKRIVPQAVHRASSSANLPKVHLDREREKTKIYQINKHRSMWDQDDSVERRQKMEAKWHQSRLDDILYKKQDIKQRNFDCTWVNFPEAMVAKPKRQVVNFALVENQLKTVTCRRRSREERPETAKPCGDEARQFISQWDNNNAMVNRNRFGRAANNCPPPIMTRSAVDVGRDRQTQFYY
ncbi:uncharacterized protein Dwil_GK27037 [Drosophila willistoni]|uniref:Uncharacterized protein n=1 Tax=Drosophila willistoni TaxID=7260 RepID=A0A0Q9WUD1_DROWI|nr:uncharacterized protein LOC26529039 [Drosophila willistoni]KRF99786.1 uncharacterized protein Dwil_GK27037 [Drosophila willistoni]